MPEQVPRKARAPIAQHAPAAVLCITTLALSAIPIYTLIHAFVAYPDAIHEELLRPGRSVLLLRSLLIALLIAWLATLIALPIARILIARTTRVRTLLCGLLLCPVWLPPFMIYAAGNLLRAPDTVLGRALIDFATSAPDRRWVTIWAGYAIAVLGLALWAAPVAAVLIAAGLGSRSNLYDEMLALEPIGRFKRIIFQFRLQRGVIIRAVALVTVLMLGSAVPLHLAQLDTWSIVTWRQLTETPPADWGRIWVSALPMLIAAAIGARLISGMLTQANAPHDPGTHKPEVSKSAMLLAVLIFLGAVLIPLVSMFFSLDDPRSVIQFWRVNAGAVQDTGLTSLCVGITVTLIALLSANTFVSPIRTHRRIAHGALLALCIIGLTPGVLLGAAIARHGVLGLDLPLIAPYWASLTRFAFVGCIIGALGAASETPDRRSVRVQIAGSSLLAWCITVLPTLARPLLATLAIATLLALFEIEAAVMVTPPGIENLPQQILSDLHYARLEQLSAAGVNLMSMGAIVAIIASIFMTRGFQSSRSGN